MSTPPADRASRGRLDGRVAVVTGGGRGIGRAIARRFAHEGATIVISSRTQSDLEAVLAEARAAGLEGESVVADAMDQREAGEPVRVALTRYGRVDVLVNNVGGLWASDHDPFTCDMDIFAQNLTLNLTSAWWTTREALPAMRQRRFGRIINLGSGASKRSGSTVSYTAAKHGVVGLTRALAAYVADDGITVNCLCPGLTDTGLIDWDTIAKRAGVTPEEARAGALAATLQHRVMDPEEVSGMAALLASEDGRAVTAQVISVDGGYKV